jgi:uncharacterized phage-associated protein
MIVHTVADYLLSKGVKPNGEPMTQLSLQKMLYFSQGWHLAIREEPLFFEEIRAWRHGPVVREIYNRFRHFGDRPIGKSAMLIQPEAILSNATRSLIDEVWDKYSQYSAHQLVGITHRDGPWKDMRGDLPKEADSDLLIAEEDMFNWFKREYEVALTPRNEPIMHDIAAEFAALQVA